MQIRGICTINVGRGVREGPLGVQLEWLKSLGCFTEIIQYKTRVFVPTNRSCEILAQLLAEH